jgi:hypothetical protein
MRVGRASLITIALIVVTLGGLRAQSGLSDRVVAAEHAANLQTCLTESYPTLCKHQLLNGTEAAQVVAAEHAANLADVSHRVVFADALCAHIPREREGLNARKY